MSDSTALVVVIGLICATVCICIGLYLGFKHRQFIHLNPHYFRTPEQAEQVQKEMEAKQNKPNNHVSESVKGFFSIK